MKSLMIGVMLAVGLVAHAEDPAQEVIRLRRENAALKAEVAKLKEELAAAKPAAPKATRYTPEMIAKLIPKDVIPADGKWDQARKEKAKKVMEANLAGEWIQVDVTVREILNDGDRSGGINATRVQVGPFSVSVECRFPEPLLKNAPAEGKPISIIGKVKVANIVRADPGFPAILCVGLTECRIAK